MRKSCQPCFVTDTGKHVLLNRVTFSDRAIAESFLQNALHEAPEILPVDQFDSSFNPLISLGREIDNIDNLFISPSGRLTIVETKLWRNPEATREVVAQILDYATRVSGWSYSELENKARHALAPSPIGDHSLFDFVASAAEGYDLSEAEFVDDVQRTLQTGRFLLLVVGDGIREKLEAMLTSLHEHPQKLFTFGLVEMQVFRANAASGSHLIVPQIVANTTEIVRAVVRVETTGNASVSVEIDEPEPEGRQFTSRRTLSRDEFFSAISDPETRELFSDLLSQCEELGAEPGWRSSSVSVQLPDPAGSRQRLTLFVMTTGGNVYLGWLSGQLERAGISPQLASDYVRDLCILFPNVQQNKKDPDSLSRFLKAGEIDGVQGDFVEIVKKVINRIKKQG
jgi:hypothetical protein